MSTAPDGVTRIDLTTLPVREQGAITYAMRIRAGLQNARQYLARDLQAGEIDESTAEYTTGLIALLDRSILSDMADMSGATPPPGAHITGAFGVSTEGKQ